MTNTKKYYYGNEISEYGIRNGFVDYRTLAQSFNHVLNNNIINNVCDWELVCGCEFEDGSEDFKEIFQYYIVDENGADILINETNEIVFYNESLDMYVWGVTHYGTAWDNVLTNIMINW